MNIFITYSNEYYNKTKRFSLVMAKLFGGFQKVIGYSPEDIDDVFFETNSDILKVPRGNGLWLWKPYFVNKALEMAEEGDVVFYCDAASFFIKKVDSIIDTMDDIWIADLPLIEKEYTKEEAFRILECEGDEFRNSNQMQASILGFRKNNKTTEFVREWLFYCCNYEAISTESYDVATGMKVDANHRMDQSILSLLAKKYKIKPHKDPTQFGKFPEKYKQIDKAYRVTEHEDKYPASIVLHRTADVKFIVSFNQYLTTILPSRLVISLTKSYRNIKNKFSN